MGLSNTDIRARPVGRLTNLGVNIRMQFSGSIGSKDASKSNHQLSLALFFSMKQIALGFVLITGLATQVSDPRSPSTIEMAERLARIYREHDWTADPNKPAERAYYYQQLLLRKLPSDKEVRARYERAIYLLEAGDSATAANEARQLLEWLPRSGLTRDANFEREVVELEAISWLRAGEQQNCLRNHNAQSCVYPISGAGVHKDCTGAQRAADLWSGLLRDGRATLIDKWLLNIAWMTLGARPPDTPESWILPTPVIPDEYDIGQFQDVATESGLMIANHAGGAVAEDFDGDGYFDLVVSGSGPKDQLRYFHNNGDGTFTDQSHAAGLDGETGGLNIVHADYNNDGWPDILVLRGGWWGKFGDYPCSLLRNNGPDAHGQITFTDVTEEAGLLSAHPTQTAAWADYDNDGYLDLMLGHETNTEDVFPSQLFHNNRNGTFTDVAPQSGVANLRFVKGIAWGDYNDDGRPDMYISRKGAPGILFRNDGPGQGGGWRFTDVTKQAGLSGPTQTFPTWFFDYNNDGRLDLLVAGYYYDTLDDIPAFHLGLPNKAETIHLYRNNGNDTFTDVAKSVSLDRVILPMGTGFGDLDNDGWLDCYFGTGTPDYEALLPNRMFRNDRGIRFQDVTLSGRFGQLQKGHAVSFADFDRDGQQDVFEEIGGAFPGDTYMSSLLHNPGHPGNHWLGLKLEGVKSNRSAIGASVRLDTAGRSIYRVVNTGTSFGDSPLELHFGLGANSSIERIFIRWPSGLRQTITGLTCDRVYALREGETAAKLVPLKAFALGAGVSRPHAAH